MAYATQDDIITLYSLDALFVADRDGDGTPDAAAVDRALVSASEEIDSYLGVRHALPLPDVPGLLVQLAVDIALYRLASSRDLLSDEHRRRYEDAIKHLNKLATGGASLNLPGPVDADTGAATLPSSPRPVVSAGPERLFTRETLRGM